MRNILILLAVLVVGLFIVAQERQTKLAVMEIEDKSGKLSPALLENAAEALRTEIGATNKFVLISKERQRAVIKEQKKESWKECYDQSCRIQLGQALAADTVLQSSVNLFGGTYTLTSELIDLAKEATIKTAKAEFDGTEKGLADAIKSIATQLAGKKAGGSSFQTGKIGEQVEAWEIGQGEETIVKFDSVPTGAVVTVDGKLLCQATPCSKMLTQGKHEITIQKENYLPKSKVFDIVKGRPPLVAELQPDFGWLEVSSTPSGIEVLLDGKSIGKTPVAKRELNPGPHQIETTDNCFYQTGEKFVLARSETKTIALDMKPKEAGIKVTAQDEKGNDVEAEVFVDDKKIGVTPYTYKIPLCSRTLVVQRDTFAYSKTLNLSEKQTEEVSATLKPKERYVVVKDIVVDKNTALMWQRGHAKNSRTQNEAVRYCESLRLGGYDDWYLPDISELKTMIVGCQSNTDACPVSATCLSDNCLSDLCSCNKDGGPGEEGCYWQKEIWEGVCGRFWSSSKEGEDHRWFAYFREGSIIHHQDSYDDYDYSMVRCARQLTASEQTINWGKKSSQLSSDLKKESANNYEIKKHLVIDKSTHLTWQRKRAEKQMNHDSALKYCEDLSIDGYDDWRLPTLSELKTLIVGCQSKDDNICDVNDSCLRQRCTSEQCHCKEDKGPGEKGFYWEKGVWQGAVDKYGIFWASTTSAENFNEPSSWHVSFHAGALGNWGSRDLDFWVRCVRNNKKLEKNR